MEQSTLISTETFLAFLISNSLNVSHHLPILLQTQVRTLTVDNFDFVLIGFDFSLNLEY